MDIYSYAQDIVTTYKNGTNAVDVVEGLSFAMYNNLIETEFLASGHYRNGDFEKDGTLRPFHDIITRILENQRSAEEVDTSDLQLATNDSEFHLRAQLLNSYNQDWLDNNHIDLMLNDAIETRGKNGGVLLKVVESTDDIAIEVVDWSTYAGDEADIENGVKVITMFYTPSKLLETAEEMDWDIEVAKKGIELYANANKEESGYREQRETTGNYVLVREVSGSLPRQMIDENADEYTYSFQMHYLIGTEFHDEGGSKGMTLLSLEPEKSPFYYLPYKKRGNNANMLGIGMVEKAKHAQVQSNRGAQNYKKAMEFASTHVLQSASKNLKGKNVLSQVPSGTIIQHEEGKPIQGVDMSPQALRYLDAYLASWQNQVDRATGTYAVSTGEQLPSGTPYRLGAILDQNAQSQFDLRRQEFGILLNRIYQDRIIPYFIEKIKNASELNLKFSADELQKIDDDIEAKIIDKKIIKRWFAGAYKTLPPIQRFQAMMSDRAMYIEGMDEILKKGQSRRTIVNDIGADWRKYWNEAKGKIYVQVTNEKKKKGTALESINNILLQYLQFKPQLDQDPEARKLFNSIVQFAGIDPIDFTNSQPIEPVQAGAKPLKEKEPQTMTARNVEN
jgi:hypothetical protein